MAGAVARARDNDLGQAGDRAGVDGRRDFGDVLDVVVETARYGGRGAGVHADVLEDFADGVEDAARVGLVDDVVVAGVDGLGGVGGGERRG